MLQTLHPVAFLGFSLDLFIGFCDPGEGIDFHRVD